VTVISFPIPAYQNVPIHAEYYLPSRFLISGISLGITTIITTTENINYVVGQEIRLLIPISFGSFQLNGLTGFVLSLPSSNQVEISIDSSKNVDAFTASGNPIESAQIVAIGDINTGATNAQGELNQGTYIPGSFINISPQ
jgi:hypothetical protein